ncbi:colony stimulating factor 3 (granulocyte) b [Chanos chanos]|uniref:Colony stimulating factor 3 (Granulocyte) b n=1 Tax=Chanos chanos TaxID=29144 RepID=A0A6J2WXU8_CHACN|nr:uncharacterized protein LOC115829192 [Chanos chanos]
MSAPQFYLAVLSLHCCFATLAFTAPLQGNSMELKQAVERGTSLIKKILNDIPGVHDSCVTIEDLTLDTAKEAKNLEYMVTLLNIPRAPTLKALSEDFTLEMSLNRISDGVSLHQRLLTAVKKRVSPSDKLTNLLADVRDLLAQVQQMQKLAKVPAASQPQTATDISSRLTGDYEVQVATHLTLKQLQSFGQDIFRTLRHIVLSKPSSSS